MRYLHKYTVKQALSEALSDMRDVSGTDEMINTTYGEFETIGDMIRGLKDLNSAQSQDRLTNTMKAVGLEIPKATIIGPLIAAAEYFGRIRSDTSGVASTADIDLIEEFPLLDLLDIHPIFFEVLDDSLLSDVQELYMEQVIKKLQPSDPISRLIDVNVYIQKYLKMMYNVSFQLEDVKEITH